VTSVAESKGQGGSCQVVGPLSDVTDSSTGLISMRVSSIRRQIIKLLPPVRRVSLRLAPKAKSGDDERRGRNDPFANLN
jgi:hypothetical protein